MLNGITGEYRLRVARRDRLPAARSVAGVCKTRCMSEWFSGDVVANGVRIHYYRTAGDKPPLVLSHGATDSGLCWTRVARALESDYDVICPTRAGTACPMHHSAA